MNVEKNLKIIKFVLIIVGIIGTLLIGITSYLKYQYIDFEGNDFIIHVILPLCVIPMIILFLTGGYFILKKVLITEDKKRKDYLKNNETHN